MISKTRIFWLFGRSGAGKTTLALALRRGLTDRAIPVFLLDGDDMRSGLCADLGFTTEARTENHRRIAEVANLAANQGYNVVVSTMAPEHKQRDVVSQVLAGRLVWIYVHAPLNVCIQRDPKGLYQRARTGAVKHLLDYPFEVPRPAEREIFIDTVAEGIQQCHQSLIDQIKEHLNDYAI